MAPLHVLIVDDIPLLVLTYSIVLTQHGYEVKAAQTCADAIEALRSQSFDLLLCDVTLDRGHTGWEVIDVARELHPHMPIALLTGSDHGDLRERADTMGLNVLFKPLPVTELLEAMTQMLPNSDDSPLTLAFGAA